MGAEILIQPIGRVRSPFGEKFGIPRQAGLAPSAHGEVVLLPPYDDPTMLDGLAGFSHLWLIFHFDRCVGQGWRPRVRPPRLGGNREVGVWASRSPFRPNFLGLSAVRLIEIVERPKPLLRVGGLDLLDGTPVFDIKPYLPYADVIADATGGFAPQAPDVVLEVAFLAQADASLKSATVPADLRQVIIEVLSLDPRPAYRRGDGSERVYGMLLAGHNVRWRVVDGCVEVLEITPGEPR